jgi:uncharacterized protein YjbI with pentapeptide repeats
MNNTKDEIQHSHNHKDNWFKFLWKELGDERNYRRLDVLVKIIGGLGVSLVIFFVGQYVQKQSYYSSLLDKYLASTEQLLIRDTLDLRSQVLKDGNPDPNATKKSAEADKKEGSEIMSEEIKLKEIKSSIDSLIRANTEQTIRSLSEDDGLGGIMGFIDNGPTWLNHNIERRQLLINFLRNSRLGFKNEKGEETNGAFSPLLTGLDLRPVGKDCLSKSPSPGCGLDLREVNLDGAILPKAVLTQTNLRGASLNDADLREATLYSADLNQADLNQADLNQADLRQADLRQADLRQANLRQADLTEADLTEADLTGAIYNDETKWPDRYDYQKSGALRIGPGAKLKGANLMGADLREVDLREVDLTGAIYSDGTKWPDGYDPQKSGALRIGPGTNLKGADLKGANLKGADLREADLKGADLKGADLDRAYLMGADLTGADLTGAKGVELKGAKLCKTIGPDQIQNDRDCPPGAN